MRRHLHEDRSDEIREDHVEVAVDVRGRSRACVDRDERSDWVRLVMTT